MPSPYSNDLGERIVLQYYWDNKTYEEIAADLHKHTDTVADRLRRFEAGESLQESAPSQAHANSTAVQNRLLTAVLECETIYLDELADIVAEDLQIQVPISTGKGCRSSA